MTALAAEIPYPHETTPRHFNRRLMLFSGRANPGLATAIGAHIGLEPSRVKLKTFSGGEVYCRYEESIRGADVFLVQPMCRNVENGLNANDALIELMVMIDAAVGASAHRVIAVTPWYGYSRQDKKSEPREPISARMVARMLESAGVDRVVGMDLHAGQIQGMFQVPFDHMTAMMVLAEHFSRRAADQALAGASPERYVVVSPDAGRVKLCKKFADLLHADLAILDKGRPDQQVVEIGAVIGDVRGKSALIVDDIIDTAGTLRAAAESVINAGARSVSAAATHAVFSGKAFENLEAAPLEEIVVTDTIPLAPGAPDKIRVVSCAGILADTIHSIYQCDSVSEVFGGQNQVF